MITRRSMLLGVGASLLAAPAIVRASSLMPVQSIDQIFGVWNTYNRQDVVIYPPHSGTIIFESNPYTGVSWVREVYLEEIRQDQDFRYVYPLR